MVLRSAGLLSYVPVGVALVWDVEVVLFSHSYGIVERKEADCRMKNFEGVIYCICLSDGREMHFHDCHRISA